MNRHLKIAFVVAPFLAIGGYALVDQYQYSKARERAKALYPLQADGPCDLRPGGRCRLSGARLDLSLRPSGRTDDGMWVIDLEASRPLQGGKLGYGPVSDELPQRSLQPLGDLRHWRVTIPADDLHPGESLRLRMVLQSEGRVHIAEVGALR